MISMSINDIVPILFLALFSSFGIYVISEIFIGLLNRRKPKIIHKKVTIKTPNISAALSFAFPGFGQIYNREIYRGSVYIILTLLISIIVFLTFLLLKGIDQIVVAILYILIFAYVYIDGIRDAYITALVINKKFVHINREKGNDIAIMMEMGRALYNNKNYEAAIDTCTDIISLNSNYRLAYYNRGVVHYKLKNFRWAGNDFISAAKLGDKEAQRILKSKGIESLWLQLIKGVTNQFKSFLYDKQKG